MSKKMSRYPSDRKVYVGDLGNSARKNDLEYAFGAYGTLRSVWIARNPPGFAFVEFESARDAADAVRGLDGRTVCGRRARVELSTGKFAGGGSGRGDRRGMRDRPRRNNLDDNKCYECGGRGHYARECRRRDSRRGSRRRSNSRSRSRSASRTHRSRSRTAASASRSRSRSRSISQAKSSRKSRDVAYNSKSRENGRGATENGSTYHRYSEDERNGGTGGGSPSPKRRYDDSVSPSPRRNIPTKRSRRGDSSPSRSSSRRD
ncbi:PREDICTED: serine/arginine-rich splicing factor 3 [Rhagoletis zephyria]|uniref:serine/arginine-rich splicing factor 3 n=1 Tax=Rhagoletis zephyria TaxID=28612 RepID=UPI00081142DB|nr:PREDICTED: serine/arginine-rich splicing factor 3 [Rhagoletis zephyria]XP_036321017.1 serine/arginine-rich splicing factor 3 [Rhagoletis pomonella]